MEQDVKSLTSLISPICFQVFGNGSKPVCFPNASETVDDLAALLDSPQTIFGTGIPARHIATFFEAVRGCPEVAAILKNPRKRSAGRCRHNVSNRNDIG